ncbi:MAG TPA: hypothetical protein VLD59_08275 [Steroidobacteraceae bacterium]|nr:hypothetical protein [Steroidobacteraceae bacterium]
MKESANYRLLEALRAAAPGGLDRQKMAAMGLPRGGYLSSLLKLAQEAGTVFNKRYGGLSLYFASRADAEAFDPTEALHAWHMARASDAQRAPLQHAVLAAVRGAPRLGIASKDIREAVGADADSVIVTISAMVGAGKILSVGPPMWRRYFADQAQMLDVMNETLDDIEAARKASRDAARQATRIRERGYKRIKHAKIVASRPPKPPTDPKLRKPPKKKTKAAKPQQALIPESSGVVIRPPKKTMKDAQAIIPPHVKLQVIPGFERFCKQPKVTVGLFSSLGVGRYMEPTE